MSQFLRRRTAFSDSTTLSAGFGAFLGVLITVKFAMFALCIVFLQLRKRIYRGAWMLQRQATPPSDANLGYHLERDHLGHARHGCYALAGGIWYNHLSNKKEIE